MPMPDPVSSGSLASSDQGRVSSPGQRNAWLNVMEKEGLRAAMAQIRHFELGGGRQGAAEGESPQPAPIRKDPSQASMPTQATVREEAGAASGGHAPGRLVAALEFERVPPVPLRPVTQTLGLYPEATRTYEGTRSLPRDVPSAKVAHRTPDALPPSKVTVTLSEGGAEVWVRDASLQAHDARTLRNRISDALAVLGGRIKRISLNGMTLYQFDRTSAGTRNDSET